MNLWDCLLETVWIASSHGMDSISVIADDALDAKRKAIETWQKRDPDLKMTEFQISVEEDPRAGIMQTLGFVPETADTYASRETLTRDIRDIQRMIKSGKFGKDNPFYWLDDWSYAYLQMWGQHGPGGINVEAEKRLERYEDAILVRFTGQPGPGDPHGQHEAIMALGVAVDKGKPWMEIVNQNDAFLDKAFRRLVEMIKAWEDQ